MLKRIQLIWNILSILACIVIAIYAYPRIGGKLPAVPGNYQKTTETGTTIEETYMANGPHKVSLRKDALNQVYKSYHIYYPSDISQNTNKLPVVVLSNGSGTPVSRYPAIAKHYASWGFIVIGTQEMFAWNGFASDMSIYHLHILDKTPVNSDGSNNVLYQRIDWDNVGIVGHSQGGAGVINAITRQTYKDTYKTAIALSPVNKDALYKFEWDYDATLIDIPILLIAGAGGGDDYVVTLEQLEDIYDDISAPKAMARRKDTAHGEVLYMPDGYVTAWLMWQLQADEEAAKAFIGDNPDILSNDLYQDIQFDLNP